MAREHHRHWSNHAAHGLTATEKPVHYTKNLGIKHLGSVRHHALRPYLPQPETVYMPKVLVVEDEPAINELISTTLEFANFEVYQAFDVLGAYATIVDKRPDLVLLDWMLPNGQSGIDLVYRLKKDDNFKDIPIIMLSAKSEEDNKVYGLEAGVDDYMTKPFSTRELTSRVKAVLRRAGVDEKPLVAGRLHIDLVSQRVKVGDDEVSMSSTEYRLLHFFVSNAERVYTRSQILDRVWGGGVYIDERTVDVHIRRLRKVLEPFGVSGFIQTVRGTGYRFSVSGSVS